MKPSLLLTGCLMALLLWTGTAQAADKKSASETQLSDFTAEISAVTTAPDGTWLQFVGVNLVLRFTSGTVVLDENGKPMTIAASPEALVHRGVIVWMRNDETKAELQAVKLQLLSYEKLVEWRRAQASKGHETRVPKDEWRKR